MSISPDKEDVFITINIIEGPRYTVSAVNVAGRPRGPRGGDPQPDPGQARRQLLAVASCRRRSRTSASAWASTATRSPTSTPCRRSTAPRTTVAFTFYVDAGPPRLRAHASTSAATRRPATRSSGANCASSRARWYDGTRIERSKVRVRRLGYFEEGSVNLETPPVPGTTDQVDIDITVAEKNTGNLLAGVGYSSSDGFVFNASISQQNIFGSGNALSLAINTSSDQPDDLGDLHRAVLDGRRRFADDRDLRQEHRSQLAAVSQYSSSTLGGAIGFGDPGVGNRHDQLRLPGRAHEPDAVPAKPAGLLRVRPATSATPRTATSCPAAGRVTPATTSSILRLAGCRAFWRKSACRSATLPTTSSIT